MYSDILGKAASTSDLRNTGGLKRADDLILTTNDWSTADIKQ